MATPGFGGTGPDPELGGGYPLAGGAKPSAEDSPAVTCRSNQDEEYEPGWYHPPDPPFAGWRLRNPTDGRTGQVGLERFSAANGSAWDRHKLLGPLRLPAATDSFHIIAVQQFRFYCETCHEDFAVPGEHGGPHAIVRSFQPQSGLNEDGESPRWRYAVAKHGATAWMDVNGRGYVADSAGIGFGPSWLDEWPRIATDDIAGERRSIR